MWVWKNKIQTTAPMHANVITPSTPHCTARSFGLAFDVMMSWFSVNWNFVSFPLAG